MKKVLFLLALLLATLSAQAWPFVTTPSSTTYPISWYKLKTNGCYVGVDPYYCNELITSTSNPSSDEYLWCFVQLSSGKIVIYNKSAQKYMNNGWFLTNNESSASINYIEAGSGNNFYICTLFNGRKMYLDCRTDGAYLQTSPLNFNAIFALTENMVAPEGTLDFPDPIVYADKCTIAFQYYPANENEYNRDDRLYINGSPVNGGTHLKEPYTIWRTDEEQTVEARASVEFNNSGISPINLTKIFKIPALNDTSCSDLSFTPYDFYTPNNCNGLEDEDYRKLFDKDRSTKWLVDNRTEEWETIWIDFKSNFPFVPTGYTMTTGNDTYAWQGRNPKKWKIYAKAMESDEWTEIVNVTNGAVEGLGTSNTADYSFTIDGVSSPYQYFRFEVSEVCYRAGYQSNHYVFQLAELTLDGVQADPVDTLPFVPTPCLMSYPIHWYQLKINDKYLYQNGSKVSLTSTGSTSDAYLWCFEKLAPDKIVIYNKSAKQYLSSGHFLSWSPTDSKINYVELENNTGFYVYYYNGSTKYYHYENPSSNVLAQSQQKDLAQLFNAIEVLVEEDHGEIKEAVLIPTAAYTPNNVNGLEDEDYRKLFDKDKNTKWCVDNSTGSWETIWADFKSKVAFIPTSYTFTTAFDAYNWQGRNPKKWKIYAKAKESDEWTTIVDVTDGDAAGLGINSMNDYSFPIDGLSTKYLYFRFEVSEVRGKGGWQNDHYVFQLAELLMYGYTLSPAVAGDVNGDGSVNVSDVTALVNMILGVIPKDETLADVDGNGTVNVSDVTALVNIILGIS